MFRQVLRPIIQRTRTGTRSKFTIPHDVRTPKLDEVPVPSGSWKEAYNKDNQRYNLQLAVGVVLLVISLAFGRSTGILWLNYSPPKPKTE